MKNLAKMALGILTSVGGYLEVGSLGTSMQAGAAFGYRLLWPIALGTVCLAFLVEMSGRLAAVSHHTMISAIRERFGFSFQVWPFLTQLVVDLFVLASEIGGAALALQLATGVSIAVWAIPVALVVWLTLWFGTFGLIENGVAGLGLVTLAFVLAAWQLGPNWRDVVRGLVPTRPAVGAPQYAYLAVSMLGATVSPYLVTFYSSGAIEERWKPGDLLANRIVAAAGMSFGALIAVAVVIVAALVLAPRGILADSYQQAAGMLSVPLGRWGVWLFCASLFIGCIGAAMELALDFGYLTAQTFGWTWGENQAPAVDARFALAYTVAILVGMLPSLGGVDPLKLTMFSMALTVIALPLVVGPLIVVMNDRRFLKTKTNGWIGNVAVVAIVALGFLLAAVAIPLQLLAG